jgi:hypothetical protein
MAIDEAPVDGVAALRALFSQDQGAQIIALLTEIRDALVPRPEEADETPGCPHPLEARISLRAMGTRGEHWRCGICTYEQTPDQG